jgi:NADH-quinone oxidoreductase subunit I
VAPPHPMQPGSTDEDYYLGNITPIDEWREAQKKIPRTRGADKITEDAR